MPIDPLSVGTGAASWLWEKYGADLIKRGTSKAKQAWSKRDWTESETRYRRRLQDLHGKTKLLGNPKDVAVDDLYVEVEALEKVSAFRRLEISDDGSTLVEHAVPAKEPARLSMASCLKRSRRLYVLGKPGAGKTTFLRNVCIQCCAGILSEQTPVLLSMKAWSETWPDAAASPDLLAPDLLAFIAEEFLVCGFPDPRPFVAELLSNGRLLLLLDGIDEVTADGGRRTTAVRAIHKFARQYPDCQVVLTSRIAAVTLSFDHFDYFEIADFTPMQQRVFLDKWFQDRPALRARLVNDWESQNAFRLRELAKTPLLLALMCLVFDETLALPRRQIELYQESINALLRKWDSTRGVIRGGLYQNLSFVRREHLLMHLAFETFAAGQFLISLRDLSSLVNGYVQQLPYSERQELDDPEALVRTLESQHGLLVERAFGIYSFSHLTIHEYFAAKVLAGSTKRLAIAIREHFYDAHWREVFLMCAALLPEASALFEAIHQVFDERYFQNAAICALFRRLPSVVVGRPLVSRPMQSREVLSELTVGHDPHFQRLVEATADVLASLRNDQSARDLAHRVAKFQHLLLSVSPNALALLPGDPLAIDLLCEYVSSLPTLGALLSASTLANRNIAITDLFFPS